MRCALFNIIAFSYHTFMRPVKIRGADYVPLAALEEALDIIAGLSELYDNLAASPSEPTGAEVLTEQSLTARWGALCAGVWPTGARA